MGKVVGGKKNAPMLDFCVRIGVGAEMEKKRLTGLKEGCGFSGKGEKQKARKKWPVLDYCAGGDLKKGATGRGTGRKSVSQS